MDSLAEIDSQQVETLAFRDNLLFDQFFLDEFVQRARDLGRACRVAFALDDRAIADHAIPMQRGIRREGDVYVAGLWYFPPELSPMSVRW